MMDKQALLKLADHLDTVPTKGFDMGRFSSIINGKVLSREHHHRNYECGIAGCIGGHAALVFPHRLKLVLGSKKSGLLILIHNPERAIDSDDAFAVAFGLTDEQGCSVTRGGAEHTTPKLAAQALRNLVATGDVLVEAQND